MIRKQAAINLARPTRKNDSIYVYEQDIDNFFIWADRTDDQTQTP